MPYLHIQPHWGSRLQHKNGGGETGHNSVHNTFIQVQTISQVTDLGSALCTFSYQVSLANTMESITILTLIYCGLCSRYEEGNTSLPLLFSSRQRMCLSKTLLASLEPILLSPQGRRDYFSNANFENNKPGGILRLPPFYFSLETIQKECIFCSISSQAWRSPTCSTALPMTG